MISTVAGVFFGAFLWEAMSKSGACWEWQGKQYCFRLINKTHSKVEATQPSDKERE